MIKHYPFDILNQVGRHEPADSSSLLDRPFAYFNHSLAEDAHRFVPGEELTLAINTAIAVGQPLLLTGEPGTGKTQAAYYTAYKLGVEPVLHFQVKSDSNASDLLYHFDAVRYFYDASTKGRTMDAESEGERTELNKSDYVEKRALWLALESEVPRVLLIDEIDKASRDFPNDLLHELDQMQFTVAETQQIIPESPIPKGQRPIVFITSNSERRLPEPFLRRCIYHHIKFDEELLRLAVRQTWQPRGLWRCEIASRSRRQQVSF
jgi:MoxR-like ATPase